MLYFSANLVRSNSLCGSAGTFDVINSCSKRVRGSPIAFLKLKPTNCNTVSISTESNGVKTSMVCSIFAAAALFSSLEVCSIVPPLTRPLYDQKASVPLLHYVAKEYLSRLLTLFTLFLRRCYIHIEAAKTEFSPQGCSFALQSTFTVFFDF